jgi:hypothetical protein
MTLDAYLSRDGAKSLTELSCDIGISKSRLSQLRHNIEWPPELALKAEEATEGEINASHLSPVVARAREPIEPWTPRSAPDPAAVETAEAAAPAERAA